jgi:hypothetical protein
MTLLTSINLNGTIFKDIETKEETQKLADTSLYFRNRTWLDSPIICPFDTGERDEKLS